MSGTCRALEASDAEVLQIRRGRRQRCHRSAALSTVVGVLAMMSVLSLSLPVAILISLAHPRGRLLTLVIDITGVCRASGDAPCNVDLGVVDGPSVIGVILLFFAMSGSVSALADVLPCFSAADAWDQSSQRVTAPPYDRRVIAGLVVVAGRRRRGL